MDQGAFRTPSVPPPSAQATHDEPELPSWDAPTPSKKKLWLAIIIVLVLIIAIGGAVYWFWFKPTAKPKTAASNPASAPATADAANDSTPTSYISKGSDLNLNLMYPADWTVTPASGGNTNDQTITFTSPRVGMADAQDASVIARVLVTIRPKSETIDELSSGTATIAQDSIQIAYSSPTATQHGYPFITFIHLAGGNNPNKLFEEVMVTGANKFSAGQVLSPYSLLQLDPIISATFYRCLTESCSGNTATQLSITNDTWQTSALGQQVLGVFESLQIH